MILRRVGAVLLGLVITIAVVQIAELGVHVISPPPPGMSMRNMDAIKAYVGALPLSALLLVLTGWLIGTFLGMWAAVRIGRSPVPAWVVAGILCCVGVYNAIAFPQPVWFSVATLAIYIGAAWIMSRRAASA